MVKKRKSIFIWDALYIFFVLSKYTVYSRFVFMALMEYCLVNIVLGDNPVPKAPKDIKPEKNNRAVSLINVSDVL